MKKNLVLKANVSTYEEGSSRGKEIEEDDDEDHEMALFIKRFNKLMKRENFNKQHKQTSNDSNEDMSSKICSECGKFGHFIVNCPLKNGKSIKHEKSKKKNYVHKKEHPSKPKYNKNNSYNYKKG